MFNFAWVLLCLATISAEDEWVWSNGNRNEKSSRRYDVFENDYDRPTPDGGGFRPIVNYPQYNRPNYPIYAQKPGLNQRPGGFGLRPDYESGPGILTGPGVPTDKFDRCKCAEKFNCPSTGIAYGHCDAGKQYCCWNTRGNLADYPSKPIHSIENGILYGPGGPVDFPRPEFGPNRPFRPAGRPPQDYQSNYQNNYYDAYERSIKN